jgi:hypothetical protein
VKLSDASSGAEYKTAQGFFEPYGDYGEIAVTNRGKTVWARASAGSVPAGCASTRNLNAVQSRARTSGCSVRSVWGREREGVRG